MKIMPISSLIKFIELHNSEYSRRIDLNNRSKRRKRKKKSQVLLDSMVEQIVIYYTDKNASDNYKKIKSLQFSTSAYPNVEDTKVIQNTIDILNFYDKVFDSTYSDKRFDEFEEFYFNDILNLVRSVIEHSSYQEYEELIESAQVLF